MIELNKLGIKIPPYKRLFDKLSLKIERGNSLSIVGPSGVGKTSLAKAMMGFLPKKMIVEGEIKVFGKSWTSLKYREKTSLWGGEIAMIMQDPNLALSPFFKVKFQLEEVLKAHTSFNANQREQKLFKALNEVYLKKEYLDFYPHELSGGEKQRVLIAMALLCDPKVLIADEPTASLDLIVKVEILKLIQEIQRKRGLSLILITHDPLVAFKMSEQILFLREGKTHYLQSSDMQKVSLS